MIPQMDETFLAGEKLSTNNQLSRNHVTQREGSASVAPDIASQRQLIEQRTSLDFGELRQFDGFTTKERRTLHPMRSEIGSWRRQTNLSDPRVIDRRIHHHFSLIEGGCHA